ncbi:MAG: glycosyltransferase [Firmicutes bacterium]|nr:glycosyltransferase [Bacillota bacterium]
MKPRLLLVGHYPLDPPDRAPAVRIAAMARALAQLTELTVISGRRGERERALWRWVQAGGLGQVDAVYVESASSTATPGDLLFLAAVTRRKVPLGIYIRDYYQRFPDLYPQRTLKERLLALAYQATLAAYRRYADVLFFPTEGLAQLVGGRRVALLPPAGEVKAPPEGLERNFSRVIYVGAVEERDGIPLLLAAWEEVRALMAAELILVVRPREWRGWALPQGVRRVEAHGPALSRWLWEAGLAVIPRLDTPYHRIALPVKLFDYLSHGLGVLVTEGSEAARLVAEEEVGQPVRPTAEAWAQALAAALAEPEKLREWSRRALGSVAERHNWQRRAQLLLQGLLGTIE